MENILYNKQVRNKKKSFFNSFTFFPYYEMEKISFKEKIYTFLYNLERTGLTTKGELDWAERMMKIDYSRYSELEKQFKEDYKSFAMSSND